MPMMGQGLSDSEQRDLSIDRGKVISPERPVLLQLWSLSVQIDKEQKEIFRSEPSKKQLVCSFLLCNPSEKLMTNRISPPANLKSGYLPTGTILEPWSNARVVLQQHKTLAFVRNHNTIGLIIGRLLVVLVIVPTGFEKYCPGLIHFWTVDKKPKCGAVSVTLPF